MQGNTIVNYFVSVKDDLGYSSTSKIRDFITKSDHISRPTMIGWYYDVLSNESGILEAEIIDSGVGVKNVTLIDGHINSEMQLTDGDKWDGLYKVTLPKDSKASSGKCQNCSLLIHDLSGKHTNENLKPSKKSDSIIHGRFNIDISPELNINNLSAPSRFFVKGELPSRDIPPDTTNNSIKVVNEESNRGIYANYFELPLIIDHQSTRAQHQLYPNPLSVFHSNNNTNSSLKVSGDPTLFPFDNYSINLVFAIPFKNITFQVIKPSYSTVFNSIWIADRDNSSISVDNIGIKNNTAGIYTGLIKTQYIFPDSSGIANGSGVVGPKSNFSFVNVHFSFNRNSSGYAITIPLFAIFFLLGTIFILEKREKKEINLTIRVTITIGIFAFLFTFVPIVNQTRPLTTLNNTPTIADFLITIIILATITFTISSVLSDLGIEKYKRFASWVDVLAFLLITGITIDYVSIYPPNIRSQLIPIILLILFGLGYGLLFRIPRLLETLWPSKDTKPSVRNDNIGSPKPQGSLANLYKFTK